MTLGLYEPLDSNRREIRLMSLHSSLLSESEIGCTLFNVSLNNVPEYQALSYVWGDPKITSPIRVNHEEIEVTRNLLAALNHLRLENSSLTLWVDALCIDRSNIPERNEQVRLMLHIYEQAVEVFLWLGEEENDSLEKFLTVSPWIFDRVVVGFERSSMRERVFDN